MQPVRSLNKSLWSKYVCQYFKRIQRLPPRHEVCRRGGGSELDPAYFADQVHYCIAMEREVSMPTLFDFEAVDA